MIEEGDFLGRLDANQSVYPLGEAVPPFPTHTDEWICVRSGQSLHMERLLLGSGSGSAGGRPGVLGCSGIPCR